MPDPRCVALAYLARHATPPQEPTGESPLSGNVSVVSLFSKLHIRPTITPWGMEGKTKTLVPDILATLKAEGFTEVKHVSGETTDMDIYEKPSVARITVHSDWRYPNNTVQARPPRP